METIGFFSTILVAVVVGVGLLWLVARRHVFLIIGIGVVIFLLGCFAYMDDSQADNYKIVSEMCDCGCVSPPFADKPAWYRGFNAVNQSLSTFWPSRGTYDGEPRGNPWVYWIFHTFAISYVSFILFAIFGLELANNLFIRFWTFWVRRHLFNKNVNVFWDYSNEARWLAESIGDKSVVVFALRETDRTWLGMHKSEAVNMLSKDGYKWTYATPGIAKWLNRASRHFFLGANGHENVSGAETFIKGYDGKAPIKVFVRISATADDDVLYDWADNLNKGKASVEVVVLREAAIVSSRFLRDHPMLDCPGVDIGPNLAVNGQFRVLIVGFGTQGERLMDDMICDAQFIDLAESRVPIEVDVVDRDQTSFGWFKGNCQTACKRFNMHFHHLDAGTERFWRWLKTRGAYGRILVCTKDDRENISIAHDISRLYRTHYHDFWKSYKREGQSIIYARVRDEFINDYVATTYENSDAPFMTFGSMKSIYRFSVLGEGKWWYAARLLNLLYLNPNEELNVEAAEKAWHDVKSFDRESSFASVFHQRNLLRLLGFTLYGDEWSDGGGTVANGDWDAVDSVHNNHKIKLAKIEHLRWMAFHLVRGIECWNATDPELRSIGRQKLAASPDDAAKMDAVVTPNMLLKKRRKWLHAALVEFDDLPDVDDLFNKVNHDMGFKAKSRLQDKDITLTNGLKALRGAHFLVKRS